MTGRNDPAPVDPASNDADAFPLRRIQWKPGFRIVPTRFPTVYLFDRVADPPRHRTALTTQPTTARPEQPRRGTPRQRGRAITHAPARLLSPRRRSTPRHQPIGGSRLSLDPPIDLARCGDPARRNMRMPLC